MNKFSKKLEKLDSKRAAAQTKLEKVIGKLTKKLERVEAKAIAKNNKVFERFARKNNVNVQEVKERFVALQEAKRVAVLEKKISKVLVK